MRLSAAEVAFFKEYGYCIKRNVLDPDLCRRARDELWRSLPPGSRIRRDDPASWVGPVPPEEELKEGSEARPGDGGYNPDLRGFRWQAHACGRLPFMIEMLATNPEVWEVAEQLIGKGKVAPVQNIRGIYCTLPKGCAPPSTELPWRRSPTTSEVAMREPASQSIAPNTAHGERETCHNDAHGMHLGVVGLIDDVPPGGGSTMMWPMVHRRVFHLMSQQCSERCPLRRHRFCLTVTVSSN
jgi:hypothetical protein